MRLKSFILLSVLLFFVATLHAQYNIGTTYCNHNDLNASKYQPSELDMGDMHFQLGFNYYLWMGNSTFDYKTVNEIYHGGSIDNADVDRLISKLKDNNIFGVGQDYQILGLGFQIKTKNEKKYDVGFSVVDKFAMNFNYTDKLMKFVLKGNKQFAGEKVSLGPLSVNSNYLREYVVGTAFPLFGSEKEQGIRLGIRGKLVQGMGALYMPKSEIFLTTESQGKYIDLEYDYQVHMSGLKNFSPFKYNGTGIGIDAGATFFLSPKAEFVISILDFGSVKYTANTTEYKASKSVHYEGLVINNLFGDNSYNGDSLSGLFNPEITENGSFTMPLGTKISLEGEIKTPKIGKDEREYVSNALFFTYIKGFQNLPGTTTRSFLSVGYNHDFHRLFDGGVDVAFGGYNNFAVGAFFALKFSKHTKLGFSSDNLAAFIVPSKATGIDFATNFSIAF